MRRSEKNTPYIKRVINQEKLQFARLQYYYQAIQRYKRTNPQDIRHHLLRSINIAIASACILLAALLAYGMWTLFKSLLYWRDVGEPAFVVCFALVAAWLVFRVTLTYYRRIYLFTLGKAVKAEVTEMRLQRRHKGIAFYNIIAVYTDAHTGRNKHFDTVYAAGGNARSKAAIPEAGQQITFCYDPQEPDVYDYAPDWLLLTYSLSKRRLAHYDAADIDWSDKQSNTRIRVAILTVSALPIVALGLAVSLYLMLTH